MSDNMNTQCTAVSCTHPVILLSIQIYVTTILNDESPAKTTKKNMSAHKLGVHETKLDISRVA